MWQGQVHLAICLLGLQVVLSSLEASGETLTLKTDFPFVIIIVILAVNHFSVLYLLCFSTVVIKSKPECHPKLSRALFTKAKEYHVSAFDKLLSFSKTTKSHIIAFSQKYNNNTSHPFHSSVLFPPVTIPGTSLGLNLSYRCLCHPSESFQLLVGLLRRHLLELSHHTMDWLGVRWAGGGSIWPIVFIWNLFSLTLKNYWKEQKILNLINSTFTVTTQLCVVHTQCLRKGFY